VFVSPNIEEDRSMRNGPVVFLTLANLLAGAAIAHAGRDKNGLENRGLYAITTEIDGVKLAWTHIVPEGTPKNLIGTSPSKERVELRPFKPGDKSQLWVLRPDSETKPHYKIVSRLDSNDEMPNSPLLLVDINGDFSGDGDDKFHDKYNRISVSVNRAEWDRLWVIARQPDGRFLIESALATKEKLRDKGDGFGWAEERVVEAVKTSDGTMKLRHRKPTKAAAQEWTITQDGYL
jgi:hypothetical protein